jgi:cytoskeleton protein RodZ
MPSVGTILRQARLTQGVSLQGICASTRILPKHLEAIESDELASFSSPFIYRSFVRQFADELKLDWDTLVPLVQAASGSMPQPRVPGEGDQPVVRVPRLRPIIRRDFRWIFPAASMVAVIIVCSGSYAAWRHLGADGLRSLVARYIPANATLAPAAAPAESHNSALTQAATQSATQPAGQPAEADNGIHIRVSATERSWLSITADGKQTYSGILETSQTKSLDGRETARIRTGNAGGVLVVFNGKALGPMGPRGQTRTVLFTTSGYEVVQSAAETFRPAILLPLRLSLNAE